MLHYFFGGSYFVVGCYINSDYACYLDRRKFITGYVCTLVGGAVIWLSKLQIIVALSTTKAEYMEATKACKEVIWIQRLLEELRHKQHKSIVYCDSQSAMYIARNSVFHS